MPVSQKFQLIENLTQIDKSCSFILGTTCLSISLSSFDKLSQKELTFLLEASYNEK